MSIVTVIWSMAASACLTLAFIHVLIWSRQRSLALNLLFATAAVGTAGVAMCELAAMRCQTPAGFASALRWGHVPVWIIIISLCGFSKLYFRARRSSLFWAAGILRTISLVLNFLTGENLNFLHITNLRQVQVFHETICLPTGVANPLTVVGQLSLLLLVVGVASAARFAWKRGDHRKAVVVGGSIVFFLLSSSIETALIFWRNLNFPITISLFYMGFILAMSYELSLEVLEAAKLARELRKSEKRMMGAAQAATLGEISSALAHELNQPLAAILSNAQAAQRFLARETFDRQEIQEILDDIVADDQRAAEVIAKMRKLLKKGVLDPQALDGNVLIQDVLKLLEEDLSTRSVAVVTGLADTLPLVYGDPVQFQQVLINLIRNAADAMAENTVHPRILTITTNRFDDRLVRICVSDTGHGIAPGQEEKIFEPYHTTRSNGFRLGLHLSRMIAVAYGGQLTAENRPDGGATLCFNVPIFQSAI